jgi:predicted choloylglycine hydrolase
MGNDVLPLTDLRGSPTQCGAAYGEAFGTLMMGFCRQEVTPTRKRLAYARRCWRHVEESAPTSAAFMRGAAGAARLGLEHVALLALHEEIVHQPHCTALAATGETTGGPTLVGQNWDWAPQLYPWAGLLWIAMTGSPWLITYHYPGLWACAGINDAGLALMWTGGGYFPRVRPVVGLPTYVLIAELLRLRTVDDALGYLGRIKHAGCFIFFLGDATGATAVVEAVPGKCAIDRGGSALCRANHYADPKVLAAGKQVKPHRASSSTLQREERMGTLVKKYEGRLNRAAVQAILTDRTGAWPWLHQFPGGRQADTLDGMTIDSLLAICQDRTLLTCRGGPRPGPWQQLAL